MASTKDKRPAHEPSQDDACTTAFNNLYIPSTAINKGENYCLGHDEIYATPSASDWGQPQQAAARACLETTVTPENQALLRTFHPGLGHISQVSIVTRKYSDERFDRIWIVPASSTAYTHIGDVEVHQKPSPSVWPRSFKIQATRDLCSHRHINPRRVLAPRDLAYLKKRFPHAVGCQVRTAGYLVIIYRTENDADKDSYVLFSCLCAGLIVVAHVLDIIPSDVGCAALGLRLRMPDGSSVITTVTHGFVSTPKKYPYGKTLSLLSAGLAQRSWSACRRLFYGHPSPCLPLVHDNTSIIDNYNLSLGKPVTLGKSRSVIGTITHTFDTPSSQLHYPAGYKHDLSLISGDNLPTITPPPELARITGWADLTTVLDGAPVFVSAYKVGLPGQGQGQGIHRGEVDHDIAHHKAIISGLQYLWDNQGAQESISLLWRVTGSSLTETSGYSGSVLCLGHPEAKESKAVAFQNFTVRDSVRNNGVDECIAYSGGFILPKLITDCGIECEPSSSAKDGA